MIKMLHFADVHLDSPFSLCDASQSVKRRNEHRAVFTSVMTYVRTSGIKYVLISGDLFDMRAVSRETVDIVLREFSVNPGTRFIISPGNHDPYSSESVYSKVRFPDNVFIFKSEELTRLEFPDDGVDIYGYAFTSSSLVKCPIVGRSVENSERLNILVAHADTSSAISRYCPVTEKDIIRFGADYTALGHLHNTDGVHSLSNGGLYAYSGCLEGRGFDECGYKGAILLDINYDRGAGTKKISTHPYRFSKRRYASEEIDVTGLSETDEIVERVRSRINEKHYGEETVLRVVLTGSVSPKLTSDVSAIESALSPLYAFELLDRTFPVFDDDFLKSDVTIRGEFYRSMLPKMTSGSPEERELAAWALRYGLSALAGENIIDF